MVQRLDEPQNRVTPTDLGKSSPTGDLYGSPQATDALGSPYLFNRAWNNYQPIGTLQNISDPNLPCSISTTEDLAIDFDLQGRDFDPSWR